MSEKKIGIVNPGAMGSAVAAAAASSGASIAWSSQGRSTQSVERAEKAGLVDVGSPAELSRTCEAMMSVCPPAFAIQVASTVAQNGFAGLYLDANAISPARTREVGAIIGKAGGAFVDGGIVGGPGFEGGRTTLYLSGPQASEVAAWFAASDLNTIVLGDTIGLASALKMAFAAYSKGTTALVGAILALAEHEGVRPALMEQWSKSNPDLAQSAETRVSTTTAKAWRFSGEMDEIAATFRAAGLPGGFHEAASDIYKRQAKFKDRRTPPDCAEVLATLLDG